MDLSRKLVDSNKTHSLFSTGDRVLVAVSGGPDSVALLHGLYEIREELGLDLEVAHLQHGIRGDEALKDAEFVSVLADRLRLPFHLKEIDLPAIKAQAGKGNLEALARDERYHFFARIARQRDLRKVATGHTKNDQAETVLMWFLRGAGNKGLGGMSAVSPMSSDHDAAKLVLVRPLLEFSRAEILEYLDEIPYRLDPTNEDTGLLRNWIRRDLIPQLEKRMDPRLITRLAQQAEIFRDEEIVLQQLTQAQLDSIRLGKVLKRNLLVAQPRAMQRRIVRRWIAEHRGDLRRINFDHVEEFLDMIGAGPPQGRLSIPGGLELIKEYETLRLKQTSRNSKPIRYSYDFEIGTKLNVREAGMTISSELSPPPVSGRPTSLFEAIFDMADLLPTLTVRNFRHGDRFRPLGTDGQKKLKELFIEKKVPSSVRATLPLLAMGEEILWIPGYGRSEVAKVGPETKKILYLKAVPQNC